MIPEIVKGSNEGRNMSGMVGLQAHPSPLCEVGGMSAQETVGNPVAISVRESFAQIDERLSE